MGGGDKEDAGLQHGNKGILNGSSSGMNSNPLFKASNGANTYFPSAWDPIASLTQGGSFEGSSMVSQNEFPNSLFPTVMENQGVNSSLVHYPSASSYAELPPNLPCFGSGNFTEMVGSFGLNGSLTQDPHQNAACEMAVSSDRKKRKRAQASHSPYESNKTVEEGQQKDHSHETFGTVKEPNDNEPKTDQKGTVVTRGKQTGKQSADNSNSGEAPKENYIHVRARRGQATNSHSLAERLRREKISERMRLLQELVPGCNKITGKAVMLDEIINYVQSLQQQVEFLSMKLATVNPELNIDIERVLSKDVLHWRGGVSAVNGLGPGMSTSYPCQLGNFHGSLQGIPNMVPQFTSLPQAVLDNEYPSLLQMGFNTTSAVDSMGPNDRLKPEM